MPTSPGRKIVIIATGFSHTCTFVGKKGVARYKCSGNREQTSGEVFLFEDATELRTAQTRHYTNGAYTGTNYTFTWTDVAGRTRFAAKQPTPSQ